MKKSLIEWKKEIDNWIAQWLSDFENGDYYEWNDAFFESIIDEISNKEKVTKKIVLTNTQNEWVLV